MIKKYLYISSVDISLSNGPGVNEREFIVTLHKLVEDNVRFIIPKPANGLPDSLPKKLFYFSYPHKQRTLWRWPIHQLSTYKHFEKAIKKRNPDLLIIRSPLFPLTYLAITKKFEHPYSIKSLGIKKLIIFEEKNFFWQMFSGFNEALYRELLSNSLLVDTVNNDNIKRFKELTNNSNNIIWIDNGVNTDRFKHKPRARARIQIGITNFDHIIGYIGNYPWNRGGMQAIEALPHLVKKYPNIGVLILGGGDGLGMLKNKAKKLNVEDKCIFTGQVPFENVPNYVNSIDIGVSISKQSKFKMESEQKVRQYLACGKPIIVSPGGSQYLANKGFGSVVEPDNIEQIAGEIDKWLSLPSYEKEIFAIKARNYALNNLSFKSKVEKRLELWDEMLKKMD